MATAAALRYNAVTRRNCRLSSKSSADFAGLWVCGRRWRHLPSRLEFPRSHLSHNDLRLLFLLV
jgi:hypothetical protein